VHSQPGPWSTPLLSFQQPHFAIGFFRRLMAVYSLAVSNRGVEFVGAFALLLQGRACTLFYRQLERQKD
jgi:hypothetical protein